MVDADPATSTAVGTYTGAITATGLTSANYFISYVAGDLSVTPAPLTVTASSVSRVYGAADPALGVSYSGFVNSEDPSVLGGTLAEVDADPTTNTAVGSYTGAITASGLTAANYTISYVAGDLSVTPAPLSVTATGESMTYGGSVPALAYTYTGLVNGESSASFSGGLATTATSSSNVGSYSITEGGLAATGNYTIGTFSSGTLTVNAAKLIVTATNESMTYGGTVPALAYTYTGLVNSDTSASFSGGLATTATSSSNVGSYAITEGTLAATGNYTIGTFNAGTLTVNAATLTVTASNESMTYGGTVPALAYTYTGLVNGNTSASFSGGLATTATSSSNVGSYSITQGNSGCDRQLHDRHLQLGHAHGERGNVDRDGHQRVDDLRRHGAGPGLHLQRPGQRQYQRHIQRRPGDHGHVVEQRRQLLDHARESGCDRQLHDRHVQLGHAHGERGHVDRDGHQRVDDLRRHGAGPGLHLHRPGQRQHQCQLQRRPDDHRHVVEQRRQLLDHARESGRHRQLHDRHVQRGHADGERGQVDRDGQQRVDELRRIGAGPGLHLHRPGQRQYQRHLQRRPGDHGDIIKQRRQLLHHRGKSGCDRQLHDRHVQLGHSDCHHGDEQLGDRPRPEGERCTQPFGKCEYQYSPNLGIIRVARDGQLKHFSDNDLCPVPSSRRLLCASPPPH